MRAGARVQNNFYKELAKCPKEIALIDFDVR
jgi:hypothetical protein